MADENLRRPRRKAKAGLHLLESPFPVPIQTYTRKSPSNGLWYSYFGCLKTDHVCIFRLGDLTFLYRLGFFGKGMLSRSRPQFEKYNDVLSDNAQRLYVGKYKGTEADIRETKLLKFAQIQEERLHQHSLWRNFSKVDMSQPVLFEEDKSGFIPAQCKDLHSDIDNGLLEELSTDEDEEEIHAKVNSKRPLSAQNVAATKRVKLEDDYKLFEYLQLTLEEAFFLSYALGCLSVEDDVKVPMNICQMWLSYTRIKSDFIQMYVVYHYFRSKGWVVRVTNVYGTDFLLYKDGMPFYHASYSVCVRLVDEENLSLLDGPAPSWKDLSSISRVNERVAKEVLLCYVVKPKGMNEEQLALPSCIKAFKVIETVLRRWIPEKHREAKT